jgi:predicted aldo/keto reductase-like oxidoreductase
MQYRKFGKLGFEVSSFGMGCMRLPLKKQSDGSQKYSDIDEKEAIGMIRYAIDNGVNYIDTAYGYHGGNSELIVGKALKDGYREKVNLATKLPVWMAKKYRDFEKYLDEQLSKLQTDTIDFYLLHSLNKNSWDRIKNLKILDFLDEAKDKGKIKYAGFSFHDELPVFKEIIDSYAWDMCQIQLNILDQEYQAGVEGLKYAGQKGIPVVIMEPLKGGRLAQNIPQDIMELWDQVKHKGNHIEWAFRWLYNFPEVTVVLSGVSTMEQLKENIRIFGKAQSNTLTQKDLDLIQQVRELYESKIKVQCTSCNYCVPCPSNVSIPKIFSLYNQASMFNEQEQSSKEYRKLVDDKSHALQCVECGTCEGKCPQSLPIIEKLKDAHNYLT